jgi:hypothetical protein
MRRKNIPEAARQERPSGESTHKLESISTNVRLAKADQATLLSALTLAWSNVAPKALLKEHQKAKR